MKTGIIFRSANELLIKTHDGIFGLCKGSEIALSAMKNDLLNKSVQFYLLPSNRAVCLNLKK